MKQELQTTLAPSAASLSVVVAYDDVCSGIAAKDFCNRLADQLAPPCELKLGFWSLAALRFPDLARLAAEEANQADLLIIAVKGRWDPQPYFKGCFTQRGQTTNASDGALVAQLRDILKTNRELSPDDESSQPIGGGAGVRLFSSRFPPRSSQSLPPFAKPGVFHNQI
jgi:hypothetical protein